MKNSKKKSKKRVMDDDDPLDRDMSYLLQSPGWQIVQFSLRPKNKTVTIRMSEELLNAVKEAANKKGVDYQKYIRLVLEHSVLKAS